MVVNPLSESDKMHGGADRSMILLYTSAPYLEGIRIAGFPAAMQESNAIAVAISDLHRMP
jgi:hypothetical protein